MNATEQISPSYICTLMLCLIAAMSSPRAFGQVADAYCSSGEVIIERALDLRRSGHPIDHAMRMTHSISNPQARQFLQISIRQLFQDPDGTDRMLRDGQWNDMCVHFVQTGDLSTFRRSPDAREESAQPERFDRQRRLEERQREEQRRKERHAREFPYIARFSCTIQGAQAHFVYCFVGSGRGSGNNTNLSLERTKQLKTYQGHDVNRFTHEMGELQHDGIYVDMPQTFSIRMGNASAHGELGLEITRRSDGQRVHQEQVGRHGEILYRK